MCWTGFHQLWPCSTSTAWARGSLWLCVSVCSPMLQCVCILPGYFTVCCVCTVFSSEMWINFENHVLSQLKLPNNITFTCAMFCVTLLMVLCCVWVFAGRIHIKICTYIRYNTLCFILQSFKNEIKAKYFSELITSNRHKLRFLFKTIIISTPVLLVSLSPQMQSVKSFPPFLVDKIEDIQHSILSEWSCPQLDTFSRKLASKNDLKPSLT